MRRAAPLLVLACTLAGPVNAQREPQRCVGADDPTSRTVIAAADEPGDRLQLSGRVVDRDGRGLPDLRVRIFHTDASGYYSEQSMDESDPRLCGIARTDAEGRYRFDTINPARYATGGGGAPHVHYLVWSEDRAGESFLLQLPDPPPSVAADPQEAATGDRTARRRPLVRDTGGTLHAVRDLVIR